MQPAQVKPPISPDLLNQIDIRVGTIVTVMDVPNSDKLVALEVTFGDHKRTVLAGMKREREIEGKQALFVVNLAPRKDGLIILGPDDGYVLEFYVQPKLKPSGPEQATQGMYEGHDFLLFTTNRLSFGCLICFDSIAAVKAFTYSADALVQALTHNVPDGTSRNLNLLFVLQHNYRPEQIEFIQLAQKVLLEGATS